MTASWLVLDGDVRTVAILDPAAQPHTPALQALERLGPIWICMQDLGVDASGKIGAPVGAEVEIGARFGGLHA